MSQKVNYKHLFQENLREDFTRVNHAGEIGAKFIYLGQLKALKEDEEILEMLEGELKHLEFFEEEIEKNGYKPSILNPIWQKMAFAMGYLSGKHSKKMAMLCTKEVEDVIEKHYQKQIDILENYDDFKEKLIQFRNEAL